MGTVVAAGLALCLLHLITSVPINPLFFPTLPISFPYHLASPPPTQGSGRGPNTVYAVSVLLSQYFLVCSHPVSVWSALTPTSQNETYLLSV